MIELLILTVVTACGAYGKNILDIHNRRAKTVSDLVIKYFIPAAILLNELIYAFSREEYTLETIVIINLIKTKIISWTDDESPDIRTKEKLFEIMKYLSAYGPESGILYRKNEEIKRAVVLQPAEGMRIYLNEEELPAIKKYLSNFGEETEYSLYQLDELEY